MQRRSVRMVRRSFDEERCEARLGEGDVVDGGKRNGSAKGSGGRANGMKMGREWDV